MVGRCKFSCGIHRSQETLDLRPTSYAYWWQCSCRGLHNCNECMWRRFPIILYCVVFFLSSTLLPVESPAWGIIADVFLPLDVYVHRNSSPFCRRPSSEDEAILVPSSTCKEKRKLYNQVLNHRNKRKCLKGNYNKCIENSNNLKLLLMYFYLVCF